MEKLGDLFAPVLTLKQRLPELKGVAASASTKAEPAISIAAQAEDERENTQRSRPREEAGKRPRHARRDARYNPVRCEFFFERLHHASTVCRDFGMGLSKLEARFLSGQARAEKVSQSLRHATQHGRGELYFSATGEGDHDPELDPGNARALSSRHQGASGDHAHQTAEGDGRFCSALPGDD